MKSILAILFFAAAGVSASAQQPAAAPVSTPTPAPAVAPPSVPASKVVEPIAVCDLALQHSPIINSLKLGMPEAEAALKLGAQFEKDPADARRKRVTVSLEKNPIFTADKIVSGVVTTTNDKVTSFRLTYAQPWTTAKEFVNNFGPRLGLVRIAFRLDDEKREAKITCKDFTLELKAAGSGTELFTTATNGPATAQ